MCCMICAVCLALCCMVSVALQGWRLRSQVQVRHPVDEVEEAEGGGEEDARVRVDLGDADVQAAMTPRPRATILKAAEEACAVLPVQTLVAELLVALLHVRGVVHLDRCSRAGTDIHRRVLLQWAQKDNDVRLYTNTYISYISTNSERTHASAGQR